MMPDNRDKSMCRPGSAGARHPATRCRHSIIRPAFPNWTPQFWHSSVKATQNTNSTHWGIVAGTFGRLPAHLSGRSDTLCYATSKAVRRLDFPTGTHVPRGDGGLSSQ
jgi:hypothetical protein